MICDVIFYFLFLINIYLFFVDEYDLFNRRNKWYKVVIEDLMLFERKQREKKTPEFVRLMNMLLRPTSVFFIAHVFVTLYSEFNTWWYHIITWTGDVEVSKRFPIDIIWREMLN